ncbi:MAG TPA: DUF3570 domain-containing protein [Polyangiaceae bacterium]|nr:DUF3570 domain-containing protein [Polyangiaceae bacterium]
MRRAWVALPLALACGPAAGLRSRPANAELRTTHYADNSGLSVYTLGGAVEQPISEHFTATLRGVADRIIVDRTVVEVPPAITANQATGHVDQLSADIVTSASSVVTGGPGSKKWRVEGVPGVRWDGDVAGAPSSAAVSLRVSSEPDYDSLLLLARAGTSLFEDNTTLSAFVGYGADQVEPPRPPPGRADLYPASHWRALGGVSLSQILSASWLGSLGISATHQQGSLSNPYRRATVRTSLFPEILPDSRNRFTAFLASSVYLGADTAIHARLGAYLDSWDVRSLIPELILSKAIAERLLLQLQYRYYRQSRASFYQPVYPDLEALMAGDLRLGRIEEHAGGLELEWQLMGRRASFSALRLLARGELSRLRYTQLPTEAIWGRVLQLGALMSY